MKGQKTYLKYLIGSSQLPSLITVERSANVWIICSCGIAELSDNASLTMSGSFAPPIIIQKWFNKCVNGQFRIS